MVDPVIQTARLTLRPFTEADCEAFAQMTADPRVMEFFPATLTREQSDAFVHRIMEHFDRHDYGLWAVEPPGAAFAGYVGLWWSNFDAHFTPALEVGFRLATPFWNKGYATEAGIAAVDWAFANTDLDAISSWTAVLNVRSQRVMAKIGLERDLDGDFDHPRVPQGHHLRSHVLYRTTRLAWAGRK